MMKSFLFFIQTLILQKNGKTAFLKRMYRFIKTGNPTNEVMRMRRRNKRPGWQKERMGIIAASVFVLSALTLTGVYMAAQDDSEQEENLIDFAQLEQKNNNDSTKDDNQVADARFTKEEETQLSGNNDMDVDPGYTEVNSANVENDRTRLTGKERYTSETLITEPEESLSESELMVETEETQEKVIMDSFGEGDTLQWPIVGEVLLDYSMDKAIYFPTMQQYRYNPSIVIAAQEGETITAAADGTVEKIYYDSKTGNTIVFNLGNGYELVYGQLTDIVLSEGQTVKAGDIVGKVGAPTIYYATEGSNVYFKMTKDGNPVNPLDKME